MRNILPMLLLTAAVAATAEPVFAQGMGGYGGGMGGDMGGAMGGGMGGGGMGGGGMGGGRGGGGGHRRGGGAPGGGDQGAPGAPHPSLPAAPNLSAADRLTGVVTIAAQAKSLAKAKITAIQPDHSAVYLLRGGQLTLDTVDIVSSATPSLPDGARSVGLASALLVDSHAAVGMSSGSITTTGKNANAIYVSDPGSRAILKGVTITTKASYAVGVAVTDEAQLDGNALKVSTESDHAPALFLQGGHAALTGGSFVTNGPLSPAIAAGGDLTATGITLTAGSAGGMTIDGPRTVNLIQASLTADDIGVALTTTADVAGPGAAPGASRATSGADLPTLAPVGGVKLATPPSGPLTSASLTLQDGQFKSRRDAFTVSNIKAAINLTHVDLQAGNGVILRAVAAQWGEMGRNGGNAVLTVHNQTLTGDFVTDVISNIAVSLQDGSKLTGKTTSNVDVTLDASSTWTLTGDTRVGKLTDAAITGDSVPNIIGNGHVLNYDARHNAALGGKTYQLAGGGTLAPGSGL
jgi:hypothetical protein